MSKNKLKIFITGSKGFVGTHIKNTFQKKYQLLTPNKKILNLNRQFLHAKTIGFIHPQKNKEMIFSSILPQELKIILKMLRNTRK